MLFDRSWYNRAGVERVMGFCTDEQHDRFLQQTPIFEQMLIDDGIILLKYWFSVSDAEQLKRFQSRFDDPVRQWKLSPMDLESINRWEDYSKAKDEMMAYTDTARQPLVCRGVRHQEARPAEHDRPPAAGRALRRGPPVEIALPGAAGTGLDRLRTPAARSLAHYVPDHAATL